MYCPDCGIMLEKYDDFTRPLGASWIVQKHWYKCEDCNMRWCREFNSFEHSTTIYLEIGVKE